MKLIISQAALSFLEVIIALAIFAVFLVGAMESMTSIRDLTALHERIDDQEREGRRILRILNNDFGNSAWLYVSSYSDRVPTYPKVATGGSGVYGDAIEFVKIRTDRAISMDPKVLRVEHVNFSDVRTKPVRFSDYYHAEAVDSLVVNTAYLEPKINGESDTYLNDIYVATVWESGFAAQTIQQNADPNRVRVYRYEVQVNRRTGLGQLVKLYRNQSEDPWRVSEVLSEHVLEFRVDLFDTPNSNAGLNMNQVRFRLVLERPGTETRARARRVIGAVIAMRSITNDATN